MWIVMYSIRRTEIVQMAGEMQYFVRIDDKLTEMTWFVQLKYMMTT